MTESEAPPVALRRVLGLPRLTAAGVGMVIGAGIYVLLGSAAAEAGAASWLAFLAAGGLSALTAFGYAELAAMFPKAGAEYDYTRHVAPLGVAFLVGWVMVLGLVVAGAAVALGFGHYVRYFGDVPIRVSAVTLIAFVTLVGLAGIERSSRLTAALVLVQVGGLVAVVIIGIPHLGDHTLTADASVGGVLGAAALVFFAFIGFDEVITLAEETRDPGRTVPRALFLTVGICTALYVAVAVAATSVLGAGSLARSQQPLADVMATAVGPTSGRIVAVIALITTTNTTLLALTAASRLQYGMAATGALPAFLGRVDRRRVPAAALVTGSVVAAGFALIGNLPLVAAVTDLSVFAVFVAVNLTVIVLRVRQPDRRRPFRVPGSVRGVPLPTLAALAGVAVLVPTLDLRAVIGGCVAAVAGFAVYVPVRRRQRTAAASEERTVVTRRRAVDPEEARRVAVTLRVDFESVEFTAEEFRAGLLRELQHGRVDPDTNVTDDDLVVTGKIVLAHLQEIPDYYTRLAAMREEAIRDWDSRR